MTLDKFQKAWKAEAQQVQVSFDAELLTQKVKQAQASFRSMILMRDVREIGVSLSLIPIWITMGIAASLPWTWYLTVPVLLWMAGFVWVFRLRNPQARSEPGEPLTFYLQQSLNQIERQIWLLKNVFWWSLLPCTISCMAFFIQSGRDSTGSWWGAAIIALFGGIFIFYVYRWIYGINQKAVREQLSPQRDKLQKLIDSLESDSATEDFDELLDQVPNWTDPLCNSCTPHSWSAWADNWNRIIPSWREVFIVFAPSLLGALCAWRFAVNQIGLVYMGPVFFQAVVAAVIPFEIVLFSLCYRSYKRYQGQPASTQGKSIPNAPALFTIVMIFVIFLLALAALAAFGMDRRSRQNVSKNNITQPIDESR